MQPLIILQVNLLGDKVCSNVGAGVRLEGPFWKSCFVFGAQGNSACEPYRQDGSLLPYLKVFSVGLVRSSSHVRNTLWL